MIIGIKGGLGQGKTLLMTRFAAMEAAQLGRPVFANYHLKGIPYTLISFQDLLELERQKVNLRRACILWDEAHIGVDSRSSMDRRNKELSYFILQTGKRSINLYYTTQSFGQVDWRLRDRTDVAMTVSRASEALTVVAVLDVIEGKTFRFAFDPRPWYNFYDTEEVIYPDTERKVDWSKALVPEKPRREDAFTVFGVREGVTD